MNNAKQGKIPFWKTVSSAYGLFFRNLGEFVRLAWVLMILAYGFNFGLGFYSSVVREPYLAFLGDSVEVLALTIFAVAWHRMVLLNEIHSNNWGYLAFGKRDLLFLLTSIGFSLIFYVCLIAVSTFIIAMPVIGFGLHILGFFWLVVLVIIESRFALIYPRLAIDKGFDLSWCWQKSKGNTLRLFFGQILVILPFSFIAGLLIQYQKLIGKIPGQLDLTVALDFSGLAFIFAAIGVFAGFLSLAFRTLSPEFGFHDVSGRIVKETRRNPEERQKNEERKESVLTSQEHRKVFRHSDDVSEKGEPDLAEKECLRCAEVIKIRAKYCRYCGYEYSEEELAAEKKAIEDMALKKAMIEKEEALIARGVFLFGYQIKKNPATSLYEIFEYESKVKGSKSYDSIEAAKSYIRQITHE